MDERQKGKKEEEKMKKKVTITNRDLFRILGRYDGNTSLLKSLHGLTTNSQLIYFLNRYFHWLLEFPSSETNVLLQLGMHREMFQDDDETISSSRDRHIEVAGILASTIFDDFGSPTHRALAQQLFGESTRFFGIDPNLVQWSGPHLNAAVTAIKSGYGLIGEPRVLQIIGFHLGAEATGEKEFKLIDKFLHFRYPKLVRYLKRADAYDFMAVHVQVEDEHSAKALAAVNMALQYYVGKSAQGKKEILLGFENFCRVHRQWMLEIASPDL